MAVQRVLLLGCFFVVVSVVHAASKDEILHTSLYRLAEGHIEKNSNESFESLPTSETTTKPISKRVTTLEPVYIPSLSTVKPNTKHTPEPVVEETTVSATSSRPVISQKHNHANHDDMVGSGDASKKKDETSVVEKKEHVKSKEGPKHKEPEYTAIETTEQKETHQNEIAQEKSGILSSPVLVPFLASIGTALALGGIAYYAYPVPEVSARSDIHGHGGFDEGVRIVHPSDLTPQEIRRLMNAEAYHVSARSSTDDERKPHPYINLAKRFIDYATPVYQYLAPAFLGGNSDEEDTENEYDIGSFQSPFPVSGYTNMLTQPVYHGGQQNLGPHILGQPHVGQHLLAQPNVGQHLLQPNVGQHLVQPNVGQHLAQPNVGQHLVQPNVGQHLLGQQNAGHPNIGQRIFRAPNVGQPVIGQQNIGQPQVG